jgi:subtilisin family serine protease
MNGPVRIAVIDSGVHAAHPHVKGVAGGIAIKADGRQDTEFVDRLGHGTAVTAVIREKAPGAAIFAVKIFHDSLTTRIQPLIQAIDWAVDNGMHLINLSLGTSNQEHEQVLLSRLERVRAKEILLVTAFEESGVRWLPGILPGAVPVTIDWNCPRDEYRTSVLTDGRVLYHASGYPCPIPNVPPERNLKGISFAVANMTGMLARDLSASR